MSEKTRIANLSKSPLSQTRTRQSSNLKIVKLVPGRVSRVKMNVQTNCKRPCVFLFGSSKRNFSSNLTKCLSKDNNICCHQTSSKDFLRMHLFQWASQPIRKKKKNLNWCLCQWWCRFQSRYLTKHPFYQCYTHQPIFSTCKTNKWTSHSHSKNKKRAL